MINIVNKQTERIELGSTLPVIVSTSATLQVCNQYHYHTYHDYSYSESGTHSHYVIGHALSPILSELNALKTERRFHTYNTIVKLNRPYVNNFLSGVGNCITAINTNREEPSSYAPSDRNYCCRKWYRCLKYQS